jgi:hypothetical protein
MVSIGKVELERGELLLAIYTDVCDVQQDSLSIPMRNILDLILI